MPVTNSAAARLKPRRYRFDIKRMSADCEANYARICRLMPALAGTARLAGQNTDTKWAVGARRALHANIGGGVSVDFEVVEQSRYTTLLRFGIVFEKWTESAVAGAGLNMLVRLYHDVKLAEVVSVSGRRSALASYSYPNEAMFQPDEKAQQNRFLSEWLGKCLRYGFASEICCDGPLVLDLQGRW